MTLLFPLFLLTWLLVHSDVYYHVGRTRQRYSQVQALPVREWLRCLDCLTSPTRDKTYALTLTTIRKPASTAPTPPPVLSMSLMAEHRLSSDELGLSSHPSQSILPPFPIPPRLVELYLATLPSTSSLPPSPPTSIHPYQLYQFCIRNHDSIAQYYPTVPTCFRQVEAECLPSTQDGNVTLAQIQMLYGIMANRFPDIPLLQQLLLIKYFLHTGENTLSWSRKQRRTVLIHAMRYGHRPEPRRFDIPVLVWTHFCGPNFIHHSMHQSSSAASDLVSDAMCYQAAFTLQRASEATQFEIWIALKLLAVEPEENTAPFYTALSNNFIRLNNQLRDAAYTNDYDLVAELLKRGADANVCDQNGRTPLIMATERGSLDMVSLLLERGCADVNAVNIYGDSPLILAIDQNYTNIAHFLLERGVVDIHVQNNDKYTPLMVAAGRNEPEIVQMLLNLGADPSPTDAYGNTALTLAASCNGTNVVRVLLAHTPSHINQLNLHRRSPLMTGIFTNSADMVRLFLDHRADLDIRDKDSHTPLMLAVKHSSQAIVRLLLEHGANPNVVSRNGDSALLMAAQKKKPDIAQLLLEFHADINIQNLHGNTALLAAVIKNDLATVQVCLRAGANPDLCNKQGYTALIIGVIGDALDAGMKSNLDIVQALLLEGRANPNLFTANQAGPLTCAVRWNNVDAVRLLLSLGADVNLRGPGGRSALIAATDGCRSLDMIRVILQHPGVNPNAQDDEGNTALIMAVKRNSVGIVRLLLEGRVVDPTLIDAHGYTALDYATRPFYRAPLAELLEDFVVDWETTRRQDGGGH